MPALGTRMPSALAFIFRCRACVSLSRDERRRRFPMLIGVDLCPHLHRRGRLMILARAASARSALLLGFAKDDGGRQRQQVFHAHAAFGARRSDDDELALVLVIAGDL